MPSRNDTSLPPSNIDMEPRNNNKQGGKHCRPSHRHHAASPSGGAADADTTWSSSSEQQYSISLAVQAAASASTTRHAQHFGPPSLQGGSEAGVGPDGQSSTGAACPSLESRSLASASQWHTAGPGLAGGSGPGSALFFGAGGAGTTGSPGPVRHPPTRAAAGLSGSTDDRLQTVHDWKPISWTDVSSQDVAQAREEERIQSLGNVGRSMLRQREKEKERRGSHRRRRKASHHAAAAAAADVVVTVAHWA